MSCFKEEITLENPVDAGMARRGLIKESEVRRLTVKALVDPKEERVIGAHGDQPLQRVK
jgi:hypothetical protein